MKTYSVIMGNSGDVVMIECDSFERDKNMVDFYVGEELIAGFNLDTIYGYYLVTEGDSDG